jgi:tRNA modification GTPase
MMSLLAKASQGALLKEGLTLVLAGKPNAGKSSLLNALAGYDAAIVTPVAGTTRDVLREKITIRGLPLNIIDTAGLRDTADEIEAEGVRRAWGEIETADYVLFLADSTDNIQCDLKSIWPDFFKRYPDSNQKLVLLLNKIDLSGLTQAELDSKENTFAISAKKQIGLDAFFEYLCQDVGYLNQTEGVFSARRRHLTALERGLDLVVIGTQQLRLAGAGELLAEDLRQAQKELSEITGQFSSDDLLGRIFSSFCIGK